MDPIPDNIKKHKKEVETKALDFRSHLAVDIWS